MANVLGFFKKIMPFVTTGLSLAGPPGVLAANILGKVLNVTSPNPDSVTEALSNVNMTPELQAQLAEAELTYKQQMQAMGFQHESDMEKAMVDDRESARTMQTSTKSWIPAVLTIVVVTMCLSIEGWYSYAIFHGQAFNSDGAIVIGRILGTLDSALIMVLGFWFGSSAGSEAKTQIMADQAKGNGK